MTGKEMIYPRKTFHWCKPIQHKLPAHKTFWIKALNGKSTKISVTSIPIIGRSKNFAGALAIFWDNEVI